VLQGLGGLDTLEEFACSQVLGCKGRDCVQYSVKKNFRCVEEFIERVRELVLR